MFINFNTNQTNLPIDLATYLEPDHIVFHIYNFVHSLDSSYFEMFRTTNGRPAYHPKAILMALLYAYSEGTFSGRKIEKMM
ncbi:transposase, partial [Atopobacter phocae]|uniref:transposase n=1 Tax=Atopobacter phocae TaxID=136492 RepID=UPI00046F6650